MQEKDLIKYIKGESNSGEKKLVLEWIRKDKINQKRYSDLKAKYVVSGLDSAQTPNLQRAYRSFSTKKNRKTKVFYKSVAAIAAAMILPLMIWQSYIYFGNDKLIVDSEFTGNSNVSITTKHGDQKTIRLDDGSIISLNANSRLIYPKKFTDSIRKVILIGEAFFDIKRDVKKPFIVHTKHLKVKVLGTSFNVKSYPKDEKIETTLVTGRVEVLQEKIKTPIILKPSQRAVFDKKKSKFKVDNVDSKNILAWQEGKLVFDKTPLKQVILDLNRMYNIEFVIESDTLLQYEYTGEFDNLKLEEVLELIKISSPINYKYVNNKVMLNSE